MFSMMPRIGTRTSWNIRTPLRASIRLTSAGWVTTIAPVSGACCDSVSWASPVPGGRSITRMSSGPHGTWPRNELTACATFAQRPQRLEREYPGRVAVVPGDLVGVVADRGHRHRGRGAGRRFSFGQHAERVRRLRPVLLAGGARAVRPQVPPGHERGRPV